MSDIVNTETVTLPNITLENKARYKITFDNGNSDIVRYGGFVSELSEAICDHCLKPRMRHYWFYTGARSNCNCQYFYGTECIKRINIIKL